MRGAGNVDLDMAQCFELVFSALSALNKVSGETKHSTWFGVLPLGGGQSAGIFSNFWVGVFWWGALSYHSVGKSDLPILQNFSALQRDRTQSKMPDNSCA